MSNILIEANNITKIYDPDIFLKRGKNTYALDNVNFVLDEGDFICIMGPSGSGKSTLLNCLSTLDKISSGSIKIMDKDISTLNKNELCQFRYEYLGFVFQDHNLISYLSVFDNIASPAVLAKENPKTLQSRVVKIARDLEIEDLLDKFPNECSGGECQRIAIARALINQPKILVCDEPTGNLDSKNSHKVLNILSHLNQTGTTILLVTHDAMIASYAKTMIYLYDGGIQTVIHKHQETQIEFFKNINSITTQDSLLKEFSETVLPEVDSQETDEEDTIPAIVIQDTKKEFGSRQSFYIIIDGQPYDKDRERHNTPLHINGTTVRYRNQKNDDIQFDLSSVQEISFHLKARFVNFGLFSQYTFSVLIDLKTAEGTYLWKAKNQDDFINIIQYFHQLQIPIDDPRKIEEAYKKYPKEYERTKYFQRTHKDLIKYGKAENTNGVITNKFK